MSKFVKIGTNIYNTKFIRAISQQKEMYTITFFDSPVNTFRTNYIPTLQIKINDKEYDDVKNLYKQLITE